MGMDICFRTFLTLSWHYLSPSRLRMFTVLAGGVHNEPMQLCCQFLLTVLCARRIFGCVLLYNSLLLFFENKRTDASQTKSPSNHLYVTGVYHSGKECPHIWVLIGASEYSIGGFSMANLFSDLVASWWAFIYFFVLSWFFFFSRDWQFPLLPIILKLMQIYTHGKGTIWLLCKLFWHTWSQHTQCGLKCLTILVLVWDHRPWG